MSESVNTSIFEHKVRVRVCGILIEDDQILLLKHLGIGKKGFLWSPPGGGVEFRENAKEALIKEFREETSLIVTVENFLFINEYRSEKHHAMELFFEVRKISGEIRLGSDPELPPDDQILTDIEWFDISKIKATDPGNIHNVFHNLKKLQQLTFQKGFFIFEDISLK